MVRRPPVHLSLLWYDAHLFRGSGTNDQVQIRTMWVADPVHSASLLRTLRPQKFSGLRPLVDPFEKRAAPDWQDNVGGRSVNTAQ